MDINLLMKYVHSRNEVANWLHGRPAVGLDVTDVADLVDGFDYLGNLLAKYYEGDIDKVMNTELDYTPIKEIQNKE